MRLKREIERKFLVKKMPNRVLPENSSKEITQWYMGTDPPIRVRVENFETCYLTIKIEQGPGDNFELEADISKADLPVLAKARKFNKIRKTRYGIKNLELDLLHAELEGLVLLEFEKKYEGEIFEIPPDFIVEEVTGDKRFSNHNLARLNSIPEEWRCEIV